MKRQKIDEVHLNWVGKLFLTGLTAFIAGKTTNMVFTGSQDRIDAVVNAMLSSKRFQDELSRPGATIDSVMRSLGVKQMDASDFERVFGVRWPL